MVELKRLALAKWLNWIKIESTDNENSNEVRKAQVDGVDCLLNVLKD